MLEGMAILAVTVCFAAFIWKALGIEIEPRSSARPKHGVRNREGWMTRTGTRRGRSRRALAPSVQPRHAAPLEDEKAHRGQASGKLIATVIAVAALLSAAVVISIRWVVALIEKALT